MTEKKKIGRPRKDANYPEDQKLPRKKSGKLKPVEILNVINSLGTDPRYKYETGENSKNINFLLRIAELPKIDLYQPDQVRERTLTYFRICEEADMKPLVSGYAASIGLSRRELHEIRTGKYNNFWHKHFERLPQETTNIIRSAHDFLEQLWETNMQQGKINPVTGIFLAKNNFGYSDNVDYTITPGKQEANADEIVKRYQEEREEIDYTDDDKKD